MPETFQMSPHKLPHLLACVFFTGMAYAAWTQNTTCRMQTEDVVVSAGDAFVIWLYAANQAQPGAPDWSSWTPAIPPENVLDTGKWTRQDANGTWLRRIQLIAFDSGQLTFPAMPLALPPSSMCTLPSWSINVMHTFDPDTTGQLTGIKDIRRTDNVSHGWHLTALLLLLAAVTGYALFRRKNIPSQQPHMITQPESILSELDRLDLSHPTTPEQTAAFYAQISYAIRVLIQAQTGVPALQTPVQDWIHRLPKTVVAQAQSLLEQCDLAKFAQYQPPAVAHSLAVSTAKAIARQILDIPKTET